LIYWSAVRLSTYFQYRVITNNMFQIMKSCGKTIIFDVIYETLERIHVISKNIQRFTVIFGIEKHPLDLTHKR
jgi:hypothetical protein